MVFLGVFGLCRLVYSVGATSHSIPVMRLQQCLVIYIVFTICSTEIKPIHYLMTAVIVLKLLTLFFESVRVILLDFLLNVAFL